MKALVTKLGDETALILPNEIVKMLDLNEGQSLYVRKLDDGGFRVGATDPLHDQVIRIAERVMEEYRNAFEELAKN